MTKLSEGRKKFLEELIQAAKEVHSISPYDAIPYQVTVAQGLLESGWGQSWLARNANNYFGVKARKGEPSVFLYTWEYTPSGWDRRQEAFKVYEDLKESVVDHARLFFRKKKGKYIYHRALSCGQDAECFARALTGVYSSDPNYGEKLIEVMRELGLVE